MATSEWNPQAGSFLRHARLIGGITLLSRLVGLAREMVAFRLFGDTGVWAAWKVAFTVPNLFRKLLGEGALASAFVPLYARQVEQDERGASAFATAPEFTRAGLTLLFWVLLAVTVVGEGVLLAILWLVELSPNNQLVLRFSIVMLPYVTLVCLTAFLSGVLQVHHRFGAAAMTSVVLNVCLILIIIAAAIRYDLDDPAQQVSAAYLLSAGVLVAGIVQAGILVPSLRRVGFRFRLARRFWTPLVRRMVILTGPLALGAGVLQIGVMLDKGIAQFLAEQPGYTTFRLSGHEVRFPIAEGAAARLDLAQFMYQFPLGVFAIALGTAIFPLLGRTGAEPRSDAFRDALRRGVEASLFIGLPASAGMILVADPAIRLLFVGGRFSSESAGWVAQSTAIYSGAIWAFSMLHIINRGFYSLEDTRTPLIWTSINLLMNLVIELPLLWTPLRESGMAVGTLVSFSIQAVAMLWVLDRRVGGLGLAQLSGRAGRMLAATLVMTAVGVALWLTPWFSSSGGRSDHAIRLVTLMVVCAGVYFASCRLMGLDVMRLVPRRRGGEAAAAESRRPQESTPVDPDMPA
jgi:putative peptidoglycan lipid II flippase